VKLGINPDACSGCRTCELVCALEIFGEINPKKSTIRIVPQFPAPGKYEINYCTQCGDCAIACPVEAIQMNDNGTYIIDYELCTGCMVCVDACPYGVMYTHPEMDVPFKCVDCGKCVEYCPTNAIIDLDGDIVSKEVWK